jgi:hypothetical protein
LSVRDVADRALPGQLPDAMRLMKLGTMMVPLKATVSGLTPGTSINLTTIPAANIVINQGPAGLDRLPPALQVLSLRSTAGAMVAGSLDVGDVGATPFAPGAALVGLATLSDDGTILTFAGTVSAFVIRYIPRAGAQQSQVGGTWRSQDLNAAFEQQ